MVMILNCWCIRDKPKDTVRSEGVQCLHILSCHGENSTQSGKDKKNDCNGVVWISLANLPGQICVTDKNSRLRQRDIEFVNGRPSNILHTRPKSLNSFDCWNWVIKDKENSVTVLQRVIWGQQLANLRSYLFSFLEKLSRTYKWFKKDRRKNTSTLMNAVDSQAPWQGNQLHQCLGPGPKEVYNLSMEESCYLCPR